jgi:hypothetical protein
LADFVHDVEELLKLFIVQKALRMRIEAFENDTELMKVSLMLIQLKVKDALLEVLVEQVILLQKDLQSIFHFTSHLLS